MEFEDALSELAGRPVNLRLHDEHSLAVAHRAVLDLFGTTRSREQLYDCFCAVLVHYGVRPPRVEFFDHYLRAEAFRTPTAFRQSVKKYQEDAIRLFASFAEAYNTLAGALTLGDVLSPLRKRSTDRYLRRTEWDVIEPIPEERLPDLGYISASRVKKEQAERQFLATFLEELAAKIAADGRTAVAAYPDKKKRRVGSLLRKFDSVLQHDLLSPLFASDADEIRREARRLAPKEARDLQLMENTQATGQRNLARYLAADHLDVYVATSMRSDADFVSVNSFVRGLFSHPDIRPLKFRYFNPTQSWIEDRVAKGLVEALMLKRSDFTVYMAQKGDTFGKDSEASVALGQGKPVIVYVPRLYIPDAGIDSEALGLAERSELQRQVQAEAAHEEVDADETADHQAVLSQLLNLRLSRASDDALLDAVRTHWADFDLYGEASRIENESERALYRSWLDDVIKKGLAQPLPPTVRTHIVGIFIATTTNFEKRATVFREVHPLALQVILSTGVLNGILVARSIDACAALLARLAENNLDLELQVDSENYRLVERTTRSTVRVISRHQLVTNAFSTFYRRS